MSAPFCDFCSASAARFIVSPKPKYARRPATSFPLKFVSVLSSGCFPPRAFNIVVAKFGSFPRAAASSFSVSSAAGAESTIAAIDDATNSVFAICLVLLPAAGVGTFGIPVSVGLSFCAYCECGSGAARCFAIRSSTYTFSSSALSSTYLRVASTTAGSIFRVMLSVLLVISTMRTVCVRPLPSVSCGL
ncbi:Uncharacterised protein [Salmonella enterica subsp. enterica serovar Typhi]|nr:Uncharacterised protein [Salmonella enterica subsp. enterica serovar Typhi]CRI81463.1 Uncharacterised protein [Salmonella enterica subsp. enterica serovar Typhi]CRK02724.1 Uncharacterised protein [Salmonella enterica subsp. enterica serovar Typhi]